MFSRLLKYISTFLVVTVTAQTVVGSVPHQTIFRPEIPAEIGNVQSSWSSNTSLLPEEEGGLVIVIQDAHDNLSVQKNISHILEALTNQYGSDNLVIGLEGAVGENKIDFLKKYPLRDARKKASLKLIEKGYLTGAEMFSLITENDVAFVGIEDKKLLEKNFSHFLNIEKNRSTITYQVAQLRKAVTYLKKILFNDEMIQFETIKDSYEKGDITVTEYLPQLENTDYAALIQETPEQFPYFLRLNEILRLMQQVNEVKLKDEVSRLSQIVYDRNVTKEEGNSTTFLFKLWENALKKKIQTADYTEIPLKIKAFDSFNQIDFHDLIREIDAINKNILLAFADTGHQKELVEILFTLRTFDKLLQLKASRDEVYEFFAKENRENFLHLDRDLQKLYQLFAPNAVLLYDFKELKKFVPQIAEFYKTAQQRETELIENLRREMTEQGKKVGVLVAGGYHATGIMKLLQKKHINFLNLQPNVTDSDSKVPYLDRMLGSLALRSEEKRNFARNHLNLLYQFLIEGNKQALDQLEENFATTWWETIESDKSLSAEMHLIKEFIPAEIIHERLRPLFHEKNQAALLNELRLMRDEALQAQRAAKRSQPVQIETPEIVNYSWDKAKLKVGSEALKLRFQNDASLQPKAKPLTNDARFWPYFFGNMGLWLIHSLLLPAFIGPSFLITAGILFWSFVGVFRILRYADDHSISQVGLTLSPILQLLSILFVQSLSSSIGPLSLPFGIALLVLNTFLDQWLRYEIDSGLLSLKLFIQNSFVQNEVFQIKPALVTKKAYKFVLNSFITIVFLLLSSTFLFGAQFETQVDQTTNDTTINFVIEEGDSFWKVAEALTENKPENLDRVWFRLVEHNEDNYETADLVFKGNRFSIPDDLVEGVDYNLPESGSVEKLVIPASYEPEEEGEDTTVYDNTPLSDSAREATSSADATSHLEENSFVLDGFQTPQAVMASETTAVNAPLAATEDRSLEEAKTTVDKEKVPTPILDTLESVSLPTEASHGLDPATYRAMSATADSTESFLDLSNLSQKHVRGNQIELVSDTLYAPASGKIHLNTGVIFDGQTMMNITDYEIPYTLAELEAKKQNRLVQLEAASTHLDTLNIENDLFVIESQIQTLKRESASLRAPANGNVYIPSYTFVSNGAKVQDDQIIAPYYHLDRARIVFSVDLNTPLFDTRQITGTVNGKPITGNDILHAVRIENPDNNTWDWEIIVDLNGHKDPRAGREKYNLSSPANVIDWDLVLPFDIQKPTVQQGVGGHMVNEMVRHQYTIPNIPGKWLFPHLNGEKIPAGAVIAINENINQWKAELNELESRMALVQNEIRSSLERNVQDRNFDVPRAEYEKARNEELSEAENRARDLRIKIGQATVTANVGGIFQSPYAARVERDRGSYVQVRGDRSFANVVTGEGMIREFSVPEDAPIYPGDQVIVRVNGRDLPGEVTPNINLNPTNGPQAGNPSPTVARQKHLEIVFTDPNFQDLSLDGSAPLAQEGDNVTIIINTPNGREELTSTSFLPHQTGNGNNLNPNAQFNSPQYSASSLVPSTIVQPEEDASFGSRISNLFWSILISIGMFLSALFAAKKIREGKWRNPFNGRAHDLSPVLVGSFWLVSEIGKEVAPFLGYLAIGALIAAIPLAAFRIAISFFESFDSKRTKPKGLQSNSRRKMLKTLGWLTFGFAASSLIQACSSVKEIQDSVTLDNMRLIKEYDLEPIEIPNPIQLTDDIDKENLLSLTLQTNLQIDAARLKVLMQDLENKIMNTGHWEVRLDAAVASHPNGSGNTVIEIKPGVARVFSNGLGEISTQLVSQLTQGDVGPVDLAFDLLGSLSYRVADAITKESHIRKLQADNISKIAIQDFYQVLNEKYRGNLTNLIKLAGTEKVKAEASAISSQLENEWEQILTQNYDEGKGFMTKHEELNLRSKLIEFSRKIADRENMLAVEPKSYLRTSLIPLDQSQEIAASYDFEKTFDHGIERVDYSDFTEYEEAISSALKVSDERLDDLIKAAIGKKDDVIPEAANLSYDPRVNEAILRYQGLAYLKEPVLENKHRIDAIAESFYLDQGNNSVYRFGGLLRDGAYGEGLNAALNLIFRFGKKNQLEREKLEAALEDLFRNYKNVQADVENEIRTKVDTVNALVQSMITAEKELYQTLSLGTSRNLKPHENFERKMLVEERKMNLLTLQTQYAALMEELATYQPQETVGLSGIQLFFRNFRGGIQKITHFLIIGFMGLLFLFVQPVPSSAQTPVDQTSSSLLAQNRQTNYGNRPRTITQNPRTQLHQELQSMSTAADLARIVNNRNPDDLNVIWEAVSNHNKISADELEEAIFLFRNEYNVQLAFQELASRNAYNQLLNLFGRLSEKPETQPFIYVEAANTLLSFFYYNPETLETLLPGSQATPEKIATAKRLLTLISMANQSSNPVTVKSVDMMLSNMKLGNLKLLYSFLLQDQPNIRDEDLEYLRSVMTSYIKRLFHLSRLGTFNFGPLNLFERWQRQREMLTQQFDNQSDIEVLNKVLNPNSGFHYDHLASGLDPDYVRKVEKDFEALTRELEKGIQNGTYPSAENAAFHAFYAKKVQELNAGGIIVLQGNILGNHNFYYEALNLSERRGFILDHVDQPEVLFNLFFSRMTTQDLPYLIYQQMLKTHQGQAYLLAFYNLPLHHPIKSYIEQTDWLANLKVDANNQASYQLGSYERVQIFYALINLTQAHAPTENDASVLSDRQFQAKIDKATYYFAAAVWLLPDHLLKSFQSFLPQNTALITFHEGEDNRIQNEIINKAFRARYLRIQHADFLKSVLEGRRLSGEQLIGEEKRLFEAITLEKMLPTGKIQPESMIDRDLITWLSLFDTVTDDNFFSTQTMKDKFDQNLSNRAESLRNNLRSKIGISWFNFFLISSAVLFILTYLWQTNQPKLIRKKKLSTVEAIDQYLLVQAPQEHPAAHNFIKDWNQHFVLQNDHFYEHIQTSVNKGEILQSLINFETYLSSQSAGLTQMLRIYHFNQKAIQEENLYRATLQSLMRKSFQTHLQIEQWLRKLNTFEKLTPEMQRYVNKIQHHAEEYTRFMQILKEEISLLDLVYSINNITSYYLPQDHVFERWGFGKFTRFVFVWSGVEKKLQDNFKETLDHYLKSLSVVTQVYQDEETFKLNVIDYVENLKVKSSPLTKKRLAEKIAENHEKTGRTWEEKFGISVALEKHFPSKAQAAWKYWMEVRRLYVRFLALTWGYLPHLISLALFGYAILTFGISILSQSHYLIVIGTGIFSASVGIFFHVVYIRLLAYAHNKNFAHHMQVQIDKRRQYIQEKVEDLKRNPLIHDVYDATTNLSHNNLKDDIIWQIQNATNPKIPMNQIDLLVILAGQVKPHDQQQVEAFYRSYVNRYTNGKIPVEVVFSQSNDNATWLQDGFERRDDFIERHNVDPFDAHFEFIAVGDDQTQKLNSKYKIPETEAYTSSLYDLKFNMKKSGSLEEPVSIRVLDWTLWNILYRYKGAKGTGYTDANSFVNGPIRFKNKPINVFSPYVSITNILNWQRSLYAYDDSNKVWAGSHAELEQILRESQTDDPDTSIRISTINLDNKEVPQLSIDSGIYRFSEELKPLFDFLRKNDLSFPGWDISKDVIRMSVLALHKFAPNSENRYQEYLEAHGGQVPLKSRKAFNRFYKFWRELHLLQRVRGADSQNFEAEFPGIVEVVNLFERLRKEQSSSHQLIGLSKPTPTASEYFPFPQGANDYFSLVIQQDLNTTYEVDDFDPSLTLDNGSDAAAEDIQLSFAVGTESFEKIALVKSGFQKMKIHYPFLKNTIRMRKIVIRDDYSQQQEDTLYLDVGIFDRDEETIPIDYYEQLFLNQLLPYSTEWSKYLQNTFQDSELDQNGFTQDFLEKLYFQWKLEAKLLASASGLLQKSHPGREALENTLRTLSRLSFASQVEKFRSLWPKKKTRLEIVTPMFEALHEYVQTLNKGIVDYYILDSVVGESYPLSFGYPQEIQTLHLKIDDTFLAISNKIQYDMLQRVIKHLQTVLPETIAIKVNETEEPTLILSLEGKTEQPSKHIPFSKNIVTYEAQLKLFMQLIYQHHRTILSTQLETLQDWFDQGENGFEISSALMKQLKVKTAEQGQLNTLAKAA